VRWYASPNVFRHLRGVLRRAEGGGGGECLGCGCGVAGDGASSVDARNHLASSTSGESVRQAAQLEAGAVSGEVILPTSYHL